MQDMYSAGFYPFPTQEEKWAYWSRHIFVNRISPPALPLYRELFSLVQGKDYFVITTNVDAQFEKAGFERERIFAVQGDYQAQVAKLQKTTALKLALSNEAYDPADIISLIDMDQIELEEDGSVKTDLDTLIQPIRESKKYLFRPKEIKEPEFEGVKPADAGTETKNYTQDEVSKMTMEEYRAYRNQTGGFPRN